MLIIINIILEIIMRNLKYFLVIGFAGILVLSGCQNMKGRDVGTLVGAGAGAALGSTIGHGGGSVLGAAGGAIAGGLIGHAVGKGMENDY